MVAEPRSATVAAAGGGAGEPACLDRQPAVHGAGRPAATPAWSGTHLL
ncbi:MAG: hypothetical protein M0Z82_01955 [Actinomycetota bacterium]|nr:hypothetical protein [Actinomycetota bacterium]